MRPTRADHPWCWACDEYVPDAHRCVYCGAPPWGGNVVSEVVDGQAVYIVESDCGLAKIGMSRKGAAGRVAQIAADAARYGSQCWAVACLPGADYDVEHWLHGVLVETCDPGWARNEGLPHPSEWFWPTPALRALIYDEPFVSRLEPERIAA